MDYLLGLVGAVDDHRISGPYLLLVDFGDDLLQEPQNRLLDVGVLEGRGLAEYYRLLLGPAQALFEFHHPQVLQVALVSQHHEHRKLIRPLHNLLVPFLQVFERLLFGNVVHQYHSDSILVEHVRH